MIFLIMIPLIVVVFALGVARSVRDTRRFRRSADFPSLPAQFDPNWTFDPNWASNPSRDDPINPWTPSTKNPTDNGHHHGHRGGGGGGHHGGHHGGGGGWGGGHHDGGGGSVGGHHG